MFKTSKIGGNVVECDGKSVKFNEELTSQIEVTQMENMALLQRWLCLTKTHSETMCVCKCEFCFCVSAIKIESWKQLKIDLNEVANLLGTQSDSI